MRRWGAVSALALVAGGCGGPIPKTHYYVLALPAPPPAQAAAPAPYSAAVMTFRARDPLDQDRLVYRASPVEIGYYEYHRWAERPAAAVTAALLERLRARRLFSTVAAYDGKSSPDYLLRGRLDRLEEVDSPEGVSVRVELSAELLEGKTLKTVWNASASHSGPVTQGEVRAVVAEISRGVDACLAQVVAGLEGFVKSLPAAPAPASAASR